MSKKIVFIFLLTFFIILTMRVEANPAEVLIANWHLDENTGINIYDSTSYGNNGTLYNGINWTSESISGYALHFDGSGYVSITRTSAIDTTYQVKIEAWVKRDTQQDGVIVMKNIPYTLGIFNNKVRGGVFIDGWNYVSGTTDLQVGQWYHLVMSYDGSSLRVYVNDIEENSISQTGLLPYSPYLVDIGFDFLTGNNFHGLIDEVKIYGDLPISSEICGNGYNDDRDGLIDCADPDCSSHPACIEVCDDNIDNDLDGLEDCADTDCSTFPLCIESQNCYDGVDNDVDGLNDCSDIDDCAGICINDLRNENIELQQQVTQIESRTSEVERLLQVVIDKGKCVLFGRCG